MEGRKATAQTKSPRSSRAIRPPARTAAACQVSCSEDRLIARSIFKVGTVRPSVAESEDIWYGAALLEWKPAERWLVSAFGTNRKAESSKIWQHPTNSVLDYELDERTTLIGH